MSTFTPKEMTACERLVELALVEDLGTVGDLTSEATIPAHLQGRAVFVARADGVLAGLPAAAMVCEAVDPALKLDLLTRDATPVHRGDQLATLSGPMRSILTAERTALNFLQRLSGVATMTHRYVDAVAGLACKILDTRKTTPGWRLLEKYAVRCGGGHNHRVGLYDGVLIKDNHLAALGQSADPIGEAVQSARAKAGPSMLVEVEVDSLEQLERALEAEPDIILLDNMGLADLGRAVSRRKELWSLFGGVQLEASGGVNLSTVRAIAETGVDRISVGALTHSAPALDIALDYLP